MRGTLKSYSVDSSSFSVFPSEGGEPTGVPRQRACISRMPVRKARLRTERVPEVDIVATCIAGDTTQLKRWGRRNIRLKSVDPLCQSAFDGASLAVLRCLVKDLGADPNQKDGHGLMTPLSHAALGGHLEVVRCLAKELGANVNQANGDGSTPLLIAAYLGDVDMVRCLIEELGADINKANKVGATSLFIAAEQGHLNMVICLGELGADLNLATYTCLTTTLTPLMVASIKNHKDIFRWLVEAGAESHAPFLEIARIGAAETSTLASATLQRYTFLRSRARTHCSNPSCSDVGRALLKCKGCNEARYCGKECQLAHWKVHRADCKRSTESKVIDEEKGPPGRTHTHI